MEQNRITSDRITSLKDNEIFVFGSNKEGMHGGALPESLTKTSAPNGASVSA